jgi:pimeloyl-ACP methyl ester carboxylesterase
MTHTMDAALIALVLAALLGGAALWLRWFARDFLRTRGRRSDRTPDAVGLSGEPFEARGRDGGTVRGWLVRPPAGGQRPGPAGSGSNAGPEERGIRPLLVFVHGWQSHAGDILLWAAPLVRAGWPAIVYDALGHGESDPSEFTSLRHVREDLATVAEWARGRPEAARGLVLFGHSMGGAAAILYAAQDTAVRGVISAGAPTDPLEITREWLAERGLPARLLIRLLVPFWRPIIRESYDRLRPVRTIADVRVPVLILHGAGDPQVAPHHAEQLAAANPHARLVMFEGGNHINLPGLPRYLGEISGFLEQVQDQDQGQVQGQGQGSVR